MNKLTTNLHKVEKRAFGNIVRHPDKIGFTRMMNQGKLNMFGDRDKDKVINILDCRPFDRKRQGAMDRVKHFLGGKKVATPVGQLQTYQTMTPLTETVESKEVEVLDSTMPLAAGQQPITTFVPEKEGFLTTVGKGAVAVGKLPLTGAQKVAKFGVGQIKEAWKERGVRQDIRRKAFAQAAKTAGELQAEQLYRGEMRKQLEALYPKTKDIHREYSKSKLVYHPIAKAYVRKKPLGSKQRVQQLGALQQSASPFALGQNIQGMMGMRGGGQGVYESVSDVGRGSFDSKVTSLIKGGEVPPEQVAGPPVAPAQPVAQQPVPQQLPPRQAPQQGGVYSPYSGRTVGYTRGPYRKRAQYPQQQY